MSKSQRYAHFVTARGHAREKFLAYPKLHLLRVADLALSDPDLISIVGEGGWFGSVMKNDLACFCLDVPIEPQENYSCLRELVEYLAKS